MSEQLRKILDMVEISQNNLKSSKRPDIKLLKNLQIRIRDIHHEKIHNSSLFNEKKKRSSYSPMQKSFNSKLAISNTSIQKHNIYNNNNYTCLVSNTQSSTDKMEISKQTLTKLEENNQSFINDDILKKSNQQLQLYSAQTKSKDLQINNFLNSPINEKSSLKLCKENNAKITESTVSEEDSIMLFKSMNSEEVLQRESNLPAKYLDPKYHQETNSRMHSRKCYKKGSLLLTKMHDLTTSKKKVELPHISLQPDIDLRTIDSSFYESPGKLFKFPVFFEKNFLSRGDKDLKQNSLDLSHSIHEQTPKNLIFSPLKRGPMTPKTIPKLMTFDLVKNIENAINSKSPKILDSQESPTKNHPPIEYLAQQHQRNLSCSLRKNDNKPNSPKTPFKSNFRLLIHSSGFKNQKDDISNNIFLSRRNILEKNSIKKPMEHHNYSHNRTESKTSGPSKRISEFSPNNDYQNSLILNNLSNKAQDTMEILNSSVINNWSHIEINSKNNAESLNINHNFKLHKRNNGMTVFNGLPTNNTINTMNNKTQNDHMQININKDRHDKINNIQTFEEKVMNFQSNEKFTNTSSEYYVKFKKKKRLNFHEPEDKISLAIKANSFVSKKTPQKIEKNYLQLVLIQSSTND